MKAFVDNKLIQKMLSHTAQEGRDPILEASISAGLLTENQHIQTIFRWPSLLSYMGFGSIYKTLPNFGPQDDQIFDFLINTLKISTDKELIIRLYDQIFVECLTLIKSLPQIDQTFLIGQIQKMRQSRLFYKSEELFYEPLDQFEKLLTNKPYEAIHHLTLYLAWDRVCINLGKIVEQAIPELNERGGLDVLKECAIESFQHITEQGRAIPDFFRLVETMYALLMRDENLDVHPDHEWEILCQSGKALKPREELPDVFYVDAAIISEDRLNAFGPHKPVIRGFTLDSEETVRATLSLTNLMLTKLKEEVPGWKYTMCPVEIVCLVENGENLVVTSVVT